MAQLIDLLPRERIVLVVDDEPSIVDVLDSCLRADGFRVVHAADGRHALSLALDMRPDLVLLDINLPRLSGLEVLRALRMIADVPIIIVTSRVDEADRIVGLEVGADDYISKPFSAREVVARVKAVLRRRESVESKAHERLAEHDVLRLGPIEIDRSTCEVRRRGIVADLTPTEYRILNALAGNVGCTHTREEIIRQISPDSSIYDRTLDRHIANLRQKIEDLPARPKILVTVVGIGYKLINPTLPACGAEFKTLAARSTIHDIRNHLCAAMAVIEVLADGRMEANALRLNSTLQALQEVDLLIDELATGNGIEQATRVMPIDVGSLVCVELEAVADLAVKHGVGISSLYGGDMPSSSAGFQGDRLRITEIVSNVLKSAVLHTNPGGRIEVDRLRDDGVLRFTVRRDGPGATNRRAKAFGVEIVKQFVERRGGTIEAESYAEHSVVFAVTLPVTKTTATAGTNPASFAVAVASAEAVHRS
jgi:two-component system response regulator AdeR